MKREMLRVTVFALLLFCTSAYSQEPLQSDEDATRPQPNAANRITNDDQQSASQPSIDVNVLPPLGTEAEAEHREREVNADLDRQLVALTGDLASFTAGLFAATIGLFIATAGLAYFAYRQTRDMKASIGVAQTAAEAAMKSANTAERWLTHLERPTVFFSKLDFRRPEDHGQVAVIQPVLRNYGRSPAIMERFGIRISLLPLGDSVPQEDSMPLSNVIGASDRFGGIKVHCDGIRIPEWESIHNGEAQLIVNITLQFLDVFGMSGISSFEFVYNVEHRMFFFLNRGSAAPLDSMDQA